MEGMENLPVQPPRDLSYFISLYKGGDVSDVSTSKASINQYPKQHPMENPDIQPWIDAHRILSKSSEASSTNGKGFDFMQEEDLKKVLKYIPKGTLFDFDSFARAV